MAEVLEVAKYIVSSIPVDNLKLQKLTFYSQAVSLVREKHVLFDEVIEAWTYGPVIPEVYHEYKKYEFKQISETYENIELSPNEIRSIDQVLEYFGNMSGAQLINETHSEDPWINAYNKKGENTPITPDVIQKYYSTIFSFDS